MSDDWLYQANFKFGSNGSGLLNIRANDPDTLIQDCQYFANKLGESNILEVLQNVLSGPGVQQAVQNFQNAGMVQQGPSQGYNQANTVPTCAHGPMKDLAAKNYRNRWYCPAPRGEQQCPARS